MIPRDPCPKEEYMVVCDCKTYNQSKYIKDTMNGFVMQKTSFPFACVIIDDASTDGEQDVIKSYLDRHFDMQNAEIYDIETANVIVAKHLVNTNCTFAVYFLKKNLWHQPELKREHSKPWIEISEYIAICEGDDYWTDSEKLQRQVEYLEAHPSCSMTAENGLLLNIKTGEQSPFSHEEERDVTFDELLIKRRFPTASVVYRACFYTRILALKPPSFDTLVWACLSKCGKVHYGTALSSVYRRGAGITELDKVRWAYMSKSYNKSLERNFDIPRYVRVERNRLLQNDLLVGCKAAYKRKCYKDAIRLVIDCILVNPIYFFTIC